MKVLSIFPYPILPLSHGGRVRAYHLAVGLAQAGAAVDLACPWHPALPLRWFQRDGITIQPFVFASNLLPALLGDRLMPPLLQLSGQPFTLGPKRLLRRCQQYDLVEFHFCAHASWMNRVPAPVRVVYSAHNVEFDYALAGGASGLRRRLAKRVGMLERQAMEASELVVTCTEGDGKRLAQLYGTPKRTCVISNGFDDHDIGTGHLTQREQIRRELGLKTDELAVVFVGGRARHNRRAVEFLEKVLLPTLPQPARLLVAGECARPRSTTSVLALGLVDHLGPLLAAADVAVNPIETGSGSNVKLAEYLAAGLPVVTTPLGLRGYEAFAELVTVTELSGFSTAVRNAARPVGRAPELAQLSWNALGRKLYNEYSQLLAQRLPSVPSRPAGV